MLGDVLDMTIGLRVRRETASDENTGALRVREFEYGDPVPLIDFRGVGISPIVSVGGGCYDYSAASGVPLSTSYTTGASALSRSRLAGAPLEDNAIYYGTVVERTSGTGLAAPLYSRYSHDNSITLSNNIKDKEGEMNLSISEELYHVYQKIVDASGWRYTTGLFKRPDAFQSY